MLLLHVFDHAVDDCRRHRACQVGDLLFRTALYRIDKLLVPLCFIGCQGSESSGLQHCHICDIPILFELSLDHAADMLLQVLHCFRCRVDVVFLQCISKCLHQFLVFLFDEIFVSHFLTSIFLIA